MDTGGLAWQDDKRRKRLFPFLFNLLRKPTAAPTGHLLPEEGGRARGIGLPFLAHRLFLLGKGLYIELAALPKYDAPHH